MASPLRVAVVHYHLRRGGVTRVIGHAAATAAAHDVRLAVLAGEAGGTIPGDPPVRIVPELAYDNEPPSSPPRALARSLTEAAREALGGDPDVWHFHNHALGKNLKTPGLVKIMADRGERLLLQIHDFAEDGRPANYHRQLEGLAGGDPARMGDALYPTGPQIHYAALNRRDEQFLARAGAPRARLHRLPNAVEVEPPREAAESLRVDGRDRVFLYPTRSIRRKNMGEMLLWAALAGDNELFAASLAPENPEHLPVYNRWVALAKELNLPAAFALADRIDRPFPELLAGAHAIVTTSVAEGFGLAFLEPWLAERPLVGRKLPEITEEFEAAGVDLSPLYADLPVPLEWVGEDALRERVYSQYEAACQAYGRDPGAPEKEAAFRAPVRNEQVDFGRLDEDLQERVLRRLIDDPAAATELDLPALAVDESEVRVPRNRAEVRRQFSLEQYGQRLAALYREVAESEPGPLDRLDGAGLLDCFLTPERFCLLRT